MKLVSNVLEEYYKNFLCLKSDLSPDFSKVTSFFPLLFLNWQSLSIRKWKLCGPLGSRVSCNLLMLCMVSELHAGSPFTTDGQFSVGSDGSANYSIPIIVPPGTAGMQPQLALNYNSSGGNGVVGIGWGIDGLSQISRCPTTLEQDGAINGVNYTNTDRFCIDGQRLIATTDTYNTSTKKYSSTSAYGANGTEYRTESANFAKIVSYGVAGTGPAYFKVWTKSGQVIEYGNTADSRIEAAGITTVRTWGVNKISDTKGNYIAVSYTEDNSNGEAYVSRIDYTGNASSTPALIPYANVQFIYETRPDTSIAYQAGSVFKATKRLTNIQTYNANTLIKNYKLVYELSQATQRSRLKTLTECGISECKSAKSLDYVQEITSIAGSNQTLATGLYGNFSEYAGRIRNVDMNGDGLPDVLLGPSDTGKWYVLKNTGSTLVDAGAWATGAYDSFVGSSDRVNSVDMNGDGLPDVLLGPTTTGKWYVLKNTGTSFVDEGAWATGLYGNYSDAASRVRIVDMNGDGLPDVLIGPGSSGSWYMLKNTGTSLVDGGVWATGLYGDYSDYAGRIRNVDMNGDGLVDVLIGPSSTGKWYVLRNTGNALVDTGAWVTGAYDSFVGSSDRVNSVDMNGDGLPDVLLGPTSTGKWYVLKNTGSSLIDEGAWAMDLYGNYSDAASRVRVVDMNGDGLTDVLIGPGATGNWYMLRNTGSSLVDGGIWATGLYGNYSEAASRIRNVDMNGDGLPDVLLGPGSSGVWYTITNSSNSFSFLRGVSDVGQDVVSIEYSSITSPQLYQKDIIGLSDTGSACVLPRGDDLQTNSYPIQNIQIPAYVVSSGTVSDGIGGVVTTNYQYGGLKARLRGRGTLGFRYVKESSPDSGLSVTTFYRQDFPFIGLPCQIEKRRLSDNALLSVVQNAYANSDLATGAMISKFPYLSQSIEQAYELSGSLISTTTTSNQYDSYGNVTSVVVDDGMGNTKTTTSTYNNDVGNWLLGRLIRSTVSSTTP